MMQHPNRKRVIEDSGERQMVDVGLDYMHILQGPGGREGGFDSVTQVHANYFARAPARCQLRVPAFAAAAFEDQFVLKEFGLDGRDPAAKLFGVAFIPLRKMGPLPAKARRGGGLVGFHFFKTREARNTSRDGKATRARATNQLAFDNLSRFPLRRRFNLNLPATSRTLQILQQSLF